MSDRSGRAATEPRPVHLAVEAATGTGKSLAALAAGIDWLAGGPSRRVVIATHTKQLQRQLAADIDALAVAAPSLLAHTNLLKGAANRLSLRALVGLLADLGAPLSRTSICQPSCDDLYCERLKGDAASQANRPCAAPRWSSSDTRWVVATMGPSSSHPATDHVAPVRGRYLRPLAVDQLVETGDEALHNLARDGPVRCRHARRRARAAHRGPFPRALGSAGAARIAGRPDDIDCQPRTTVLATPTSGHPGTGVISRGHVDQGRLLHPAGVSGPRQHLDGAARSPVFVVR